jgi:polyisoprenoid-binding protein YceI
MATTAPVETGVTTWNLDPSHSTVEFAVKHMMISTVRGRFSDLKGTVTVDEANPASAVVNAELAVASIDTRADQRDAHLRSPDFFDAGQFPTITFRSTKVERKGEDLRVVGDLTIRGVTREVTLAVTDEGRGRDPWGGERAGFSATTKINRRDFGLTWNQALETGGVLVGDEIKISIDTEFVRA